MQKSVLFLAAALCGAVSIAWMPGRAIQAAGAAQPGAVTQTAVTGRPVAVAADPTPFNEQILYYVNQFRAENGKSPLAMNKDMVETAGIHSTAMAKGTVAFGHDNFDLRFKYVAAKLGGVNAFAENVAMGVLDARQVVEGWIHSPGHRKNMLGDYNLTGIATATASNGTIYFTQIFAHKQ